MHIRTLTDYLFYVCLIWFDSPLLYVYFFLEYLKVYTVYLSTTTTYCNSSSSSSRDPGPEVTVC